MRSRITRFLLVLASVALVAVGASRCSDSYSALTQPPSNVTPPPGATPTPVGY